MGRVGVVVTVSVIVGKDVSVGEATAGVGEGVGEVGETVKTGVPGRVGVVPPMKVAVSAGA